MGGTLLNWNQGRCHLKTYTTVLLLCLILTACEKPTTSNCTPSRTPGATIEREGDTSSTTTTCPDDTTTTTVPDGDTSSTTNPGDDSTSTTAPSDGTGVPTEAELFDADVSFTNFTASDEAKVEKALEMIKAVVRTSEFRDAVLNHTYNGKKAFASTTLTNEQIYQKFLDGEEMLNPGKNHTMDLQLELYYASTTTVGYTYPNVLKIWMNKKYFDTYIPAQVSRNLFHEWSHKLGFDHDSAATARRPYSVPYGVGTIMENLARKLP